MKFLMEIFFFIVLTLGCGREKDRGGGARILDEYTDEFGMHCTIYKGTRECPLAIRIGDKSNPIHCANEETFSEMVSAGEKADCTVP